MNERQLRGQEWDVRIPGVGTIIVRAFSRENAILRAAERMHAPDDADLEHASAVLAVPFYSPIGPERQVGR